MDKEDTAIPPEPIQSLLQRETDTIWTTSCSVTQIVV